MSCNSAFGLIFSRRITLVGLAVSLTLLPGVAQASGILLIKRHATWRYHAEIQSAADGWRDSDFDDSNWKQGAAGFGYGDGDDQTVLEAMPNNFTAVFLRKTFEIEDPSKFENIYLYVNYDDGFIAYLNGKQVAAAEARRDGDKLVVGVHEGRGYEQFRIADASECLRQGKNVLAIEGHNCELASTDFSLDPFLSRERITSIEQLIDADAMREDLVEFTRRLEDQSSYRTRRDFDYRAAIEKLSSEIDDQTKAWKFALELKKIVMQLGDCHADVLSPYPPEHRRVLPVRLALTGHGIAVFSPYNTAPLHEECPYLAAIDGVPLQEWLDIAARFVQQGSPQLIEHRSVDWLSQIDILRMERGAELTDTATLTLRSADGQQTVEHKVRVARSGAGRMELHYSLSRVLENGIHYVRIPQMDERLIEPTVEAIENAKESSGLVIDVRDNGGGTYALLHAIYGYFVADNAEPYVTNIAAYRLSSQFSADHIFYRPTYPHDWDGWTVAERRAIDKAAKSFRPTWQPPEGSMSPWHYMVLSRERGMRDYFHYDKPVVVLCNPGSFSATDGFLSAFADLPQATLMGQPSGGGSGATRPFQLQNTRLVVGLSSMASYRANGQPFDGHGVEVDIEVRPTLEDYLGKSDSVLQRAVAQISKGN